MYIKVILNNYLVNYLVFTSGLPNISSLALSSEGDDRGSLGQMMKKIFIPMIY